MLKLCAILEILCLRLKSTPLKRTERCRAKWDAIEAKVLEVVKSTPFCVLLFEDVNGCEYASGFLKRILKCGKLVDNQGNTYDLSNTLIILTSIMYVGRQERKALFCNCKEMNCPMVEDEMRTISSKDPECDRLASHKKLLGSLWDIHELVDDVLVLNGIPAVFHEMVDIRVKLRKAIDASRENQQLILYPSEALVRDIARGYRAYILYQSRAKYRLKRYLKKKVIPTILSGINQIEAGNMAIFRIDVLVRVCELYYRSLEVDGALAAFKESLSQWRTVYQNEKGFAEEVVKLMAACSGLLSQVQNTKELHQVMIWLKNMENVIDGIISDPILSSNFVSEQCLVPPSTIEARMASQLTDCSDSSVVDDLIIKFSSILGEKYKLLNLVADAITFNGLNGPLHHQPKCFLFLGLADDAKAELVKALCHVFESLYGHESIIQINAEEYAERNSVTKFLDSISVLALDGLSRNGSSLSDCTLTSPCRVMLIDCVGEAHLSVFSAILSLLDRGALKNREGALVDFCRTVVIITSDLGRKDVLAGLAGHDLGSIIKEGKDNQRTEKPFPYELLNRVDEIVMFDPLLEPQLEKFFHIKIEQVREQRLDILGLLMLLFFDSDDVPAEKKSLIFSMAVKNISYAIAICRNAAPLTKRKYSEA